MAHFPFNLAALAQIRQRKPYSPRSSFTVFPCRRLVWAPWSISCLISVLFFFAAEARGFTLPASPVRVSRSTTLSLAGHLEILHDPDGRLTLTEALAGAARFRPVDGFVNRGYTRESSWVRFSLCNDSTLHDFILRLGPSMLDHVTVYTQVGDDPAAAASYREYVFGDHHPIAQRPVRHSSFVLPVVLADDKPRLIYIRVQTTSTHNLKGWVYPPEQFIFWSELKGQLYGAFFGVALVVAFINAIYAFRLRDMLYGYYSCYALALFSSYFAVEGSLALFWPAGAHLVSDYFTGAGTALSFSSFALFAVRLFDTKGKLPFAHRYFQFTFWFGVAVSLSIPFGWYGRTAPLLMMNGLFFVLSLTWLGVLLVRKGVTAGSLFLTAFIASNIGAVLALLRLLGWAPVTWLTSYSLQVGAVLSMILMTLALTERVRAAEEKALAASRETEQKAVELAGKMTRELVAKQKELEDALKTEREALESQIRFVDMVSHEYRTPLAIIRANVDILEMKACKAECVMFPHLAKITRALARLVEVVEVALGRQRLDAAQLKMCWEETGLAPFLGKLTDEMGELWGGRRLLFDSPDALALAVSCDRALLKTAFVNLIDNAFKYSAQEDPVCISLGADGAEAVVRISDSGRGIAPDELERVFEKYYRGTGSADTRGAGVGLNLVRRIIEQHGGLVSLESTVGGTVATVRLPLSHSGEAVK